MYDLSRNLTLGREAMEHAIQHLHRGATNRWRDARSYLLNRRLIRHSRDQVARFRDPAWSDVRTRLDEVPFGELPTEYGEPGDDWLHVIRTSASQAKLTSVGNCGEHAAIAFIYLLDRYFSQDENFPPIDYMICNEPDHAWVAFGRERTGPPRLPPSWGPHAVVVDPWHDGGQCYPAREYGDRMYKGYETLPDVVLRVERDHAGFIVPTHQEL